jgi:hypothetical protein
MIIRHFALTFGNVFSPCSQLLSPIEIRILLHLGSKQNQMGHQPCFLNGMKGPLQNQITIKIYGNFFGTC